jgi:hypothetical protein
MIVSPLDYELYSRVTGQPIPMSAAERMKMAPVVNEFTKNYTKAQNRQAMGRNILRIGALGALGVIGARAFGTPSQETGQNLVETSTASNLVQRAADNAAASTATNTISQSLSTDQTPEQTLENAAETTSEPSQLNINKSVEASVKKPTPNIDAALERRNLPLPSEKTIRERYNRYETTPQKQQKGLEQTLVGGGSIYVSDREGKVGETIKTKDSSGFDAKGKSILNKFVKDLTSDDADEGDMENITSLTGQTAPDFENVLVSDTTNPQDASLYGAFATPLASPLSGHPDLPPGEDDIFQHGGTNTSPTTNLAYIDPKKVMAMSVITSGNVSDVLNKELSKKTPEEKAVVAVEIEKKRTPNPLEKQRTPRSPNELAGKDQAAFEAIQAGIPQEEQEAAAKRVQEKTARKRSESTGEKVNGFLRSFPAQSVLRYGQMGGKASGIELNTLVNPPRVGFAISDPKTEKTTKYSYPATKEVIQELSQDPDDPETSDESLGRKKFNYLLGLAGRGEKGIGERTKKEEYDTFVDTSKLEM